MRSTDYGRISLIYFATRCFHTPTPPSIPPPSITAFPLAFLRHNPASRRFTSTTMHHECISAQRRSFGMASSLICAAIASGSGTPLPQIARARLDSNSTNSSKIICEWLEEGDEGRLKAVHLGVIVAFVLRVLQPVVACHLHACECAAACKTFEPNAIVDFLTAM